MTCPKCKQDAGFMLIGRGVLACVYCGHLCPEPPSHTPKDALRLSVKLTPASSADHSILSADGTEEIAHITLDTDGAHIDGDEALALVEIFARHTKRFIRNKIAKRSN